MNHAWRRSHTATRSTLRRGAFVGAALLLAAASAVAMSVPASAGAGQRVGTNAAGRLAPASSSANPRLHVIKFGSGKVTSKPAGIICGHRCKATFVQGTVVTLTARPQVGWTFIAWGGACSGIGTCQVTMTTAQTVSATFVDNPTLTVTTSGSGVVTSSPAGIVCGADCTEQYVPGTVVTLTAAPSAGWTFVGWGHDCSGIGGCVVTMTGAKGVTATFSPSSFILHVGLDGVIPAGTVTSNPSGINCPSDCDEVFAAGTVVSLTATADPPFKFYGWHGACTGTGACIITMSADKSVSADFDCQPVRCKSIDATELSYRAAVVRVPRPEVARLD